MTGPDWVNSGYQVTDVGGTPAVTPIPQSSLPVQQDRSIESIMRETLDKRGPIENFLAEQLIPVAQGFGSKLANMMPSASGLETMGAAFRDAGASLQGHQGGALDALSQQRERMQEAKVKQDQVKKQSDIQELERWTKVSKLPLAQRKKLAPNFSAGYQDLLHMPDAEAEVFQQFATPFMQRYHPQQWQVLGDKLKNGELTGDTIKTVYDIYKDDLKKFDDLQKKEKVLESMKQLADANPGIANDPTFKTKLEVLTNEVMGLDVELQGKIQGIQKGARENTIGEAGKDSAIQAAQQQGPQAVIKTAQEANTLGQQLPGGVQYKATEAAGAHNARLATQPRIETVQVGDEQVTLALYPDGRKEIVTVGGQEARGPKKPLVEVKMTPDNAGKFSMLEQATRNVDKVIGDLINPDGTINRKLVFQANPPGLDWLFEGIPFTKGRELRTYIEESAASKYRIETGAAGNAQELKSVVSRIIPSTADSDQQIKNKLMMYRDFMQTGLAAIDPDGKLTERVNRRKAALNKDAERIANMSDEELKAAAGIK